MRYTLKDYQDDAVADVLDRLARARDDWQQRRSPGAFSLAATTGAGKTVMAAAAIEALFGGNADYSFNPDPGAVVLWLTDDPSLNDQTRFRLLDASDRIGPSRLMVIENSFDQAKLEPGRVYFLNTQKLGKKSLLVRGKPEHTQHGTPYEGPVPDARTFTMWETLANTIGDEDITLYVILDEAHRGMQPASTRERDEKDTIVRRLINGTNGIPAVPVVWGISATVERFDTAMTKAEERTSYPSVRIDPARVQESGLLKDDIRLEFPTQSGHFDSALLARAAIKAKQATLRWRDYAHREGPTAEPVVPLLIVQVPNTPSAELLLTALTTIRDTWPELEPDALAHVFGDHAALELGGITVPHVGPETVQDRTHIRVLFAKDAISSGWDCPRAEVLMSFRPARDELHITQLLGRMVRAPLARRVPGNDLLNSVECVLPHFDREAAGKVAKNLLGDRDRDEDGTGGGAGRRVLHAAVDMQLNTAIPDTVWEAFDTLPSQTLPRKAARPVRKLMALAQALSRDGLRADARKEAYRKLFSKLDGLMAQYNEEIEKASRGIVEVKGETLITRVFEGEVRKREEFVETADEQSVNAAFKAAGGKLTADVARMYAGHLTTGSQDDDGLYDAHIKVGALAQVDGVSEELDQEADNICRKWGDEHRVAVKGLSDERRAIYAEIAGMSPEPQVTEIMRPRIRSENTENDDGNKLDTRTEHLMCDDNGNFPIGSLNQWEVDVLDKEINRPGFKAWYRNPPRPTSDALTIAYQDAQGHWRRMCPDFLFFHADSGSTKVSIVDPHGHHLADALPKLRGLADFAAKHEESFHRIESVARTEGSRLRVLDLTDLHTREAIAVAEDTHALYLSDDAHDY